MPSNSHGTTRLWLKKIDLNGSQKEILNSDEFRILKVAEVKGTIHRTLNNRTKSGRRSGKLNPVSTQKDKFGEIYPTGTHHGDSLDLDGNNWTIFIVPNDTGNSSGVGANRRSDSEGSKSEDSRKKEIMADGKPTATTKSMAKTISLIARVASITRRIGW